MRKTLAVILAAGVVMVAAGCSPAGGAAACKPVVRSGDASVQVSATGERGSAPTVSFPTPLFAKNVQTSTISAGDGKVLTEGRVADVQASLFVGSTGELLTKTDYSPTSPLRLTVGSAKSVIARAIQCQSVGSRAATVLTVTDMYGPGALDPSLGLTDDTTLVLVTDIDRSYLGKADGAPQLLQPGFPAVVTAPNGTPGITVPNEDPPTALMIQKLKVGGGATVKEGDQAVVHYTGFLWNGAGTPATVFDSSWERDQPATFLAAPMSEGETKGLVPGFAKALIGQTVGSQVIVVIPPKFGYPEGSSPTSVPAGSTMVFVFDVLGIQ